MSKLAQLIAAHCPQGVPFVPLGNCLVRTRGTTITASQMKYLNKNNAPIKVFAGGKTVAYVNYSDIPEKDIHHIPSIIVKSRGVVEFEYYDKPFSHKNEMWSYHSTNKAILTKFVFYFLKTKESDLRAKAISMGAFPQISIPDTEKIRIPLPPLAVQAEIVRILDKFSALSAELSAELSARVSQYHYYRNHLLSFDATVPLVPLGEVVNIRNGYTPSKANPHFWTNGEVPWFRMDDIRKNGRILSESLQYVTESAIKKELFPANSLILATTATIGEHALITVPFLANQRFSVLTIRNDFTSILDNKFLFYYGFIISQWCKNNLNISSFAAVDMNKLKSLKIPLPPLAVQAHIVALLDRFDSLTSSLTTGLPAEIEARQKQFIYYRNHLLSFKELTS